MTDRLVTIVKESGLSQESKVKELMSSFTGYFKEAQELANEAKSIVVTNEQQTDLMIEARDKRLELKFIRCEVEKTRKELKEQALREGRAIDGVANVIKALIIPVEQHLEKQEKYAEIKEQEIAEKKHLERVEKLSKYVEDVSFYDLENIEDEAFEKLLDSSRKAFEAQKEAEQKAEEERLAKEKADREEQERIRQENEKLRKEAEAREEKLAKERLEQEKKLEIERKKREAVELKLRKEQEEKLAKEQKARELEEARIQAEQEAKRKALLAPDKDKLNNLAAEIDNFKLPAVESKEAGEVIGEAGKRLSAISNYLREKAKTL